MDRHDEILYFVVYLLLNDLQIKTMNFTADRRETHVKTTISDYPPRDCPLSPKTFKTERFLPLPFAS